MKRTLFLIVTALFVINVYAVEKKLVYKWSMKGKQVRYSAGDPDRGVPERVKQLGFALLTYDTETEEISETELVKFWKTKGVKTINYCKCDLLPGEGKIEKKTDIKKGAYIEITAIGENYSGLIRNGIKTKSGEVYMLPKRFKGFATWKNKYLESGDIATGTAKLKMSFDKKRTMLVTGKLSESDSTQITDDEIFDYLFLPKQAEYEDLEDFMSVYKSSTTGSGLFEWLGVGTDDGETQTVKYAFPTEDGSAGEIMVTDGAGTVAWTSIQSRDAYLLNRANHIGSQDAETISDFRDAVEEILGDEFDSDIINNITNQIDMEEFLKLLSEYLESHDDTWISQHIDASDIVTGMDVADVEALLAKLMASASWSSGVTYNSTEIENLLDGLGTYLSGDNSELNDNLTEYLDPTTIINNMDAADFTALKAGLGLDGIELDEGDTVKLSNMKEAVGAILDYLNNDMGADPPVYDKDDL